MKTIEQKAKAYDELTAKLKEWHNGLQDGSPAKETLEYLLPQFRESEDERIRKQLINICNEWLGGGHSARPCLNDVRWLKNLLEKQEQKPIRSCDIVPYIDDKIAALQDMWREEKVAFDWDDMHEMIEDVARHFYQKEQKPVDDDPLNDPRFIDGFDTGREVQKIFDVPAKWSEEDESILEALIYDIERLPMQGVLTHRSCDSYIKFLKALRPGWKPSEEQLKELNFARLGRTPNVVHEHLDSLYNDLLKLKQS